MSDEYATKQVAEHKTPNDAWITIHGKVYDVTKYQQDHPGGAAILTEAAGTDASDGFDDAGHSEDAMELMDTYLVGKLKGYVKPKEKLKPVSPPATQPNVSSAPTKHNSTTKAANLGLFTLAITLLYYFGRRQNLALPQWIVIHLHHGPPEPRGIGFIKGLLLGGSIFAALDAVVAHRFAALAWNNKPFTSYPAHMKVPKRVHEDTLLQRGLLDPVKYSPLPLKEKTKVSPNVYRYTFTLPTKNTVLGLPIGQHVVIKAEVNGENVARSYTPVSNNSDRGVLDLVIKVYPDGKLTNGYMDHLESGDEVLFRGPKGAMRYYPGLCSKIGMIAGGTGVTPMFQVIRGICEDDRDLTQVSLLFANRSEGDILLRRELDTFARRYPKNLKVYYVLDSPPEDWEFGLGHITKDMITEKLPSPAVDTKMMVCGPPGMVDAAKKSLVELGFEEPGAAAKMSDQVFLF